MMGVRYLLLVLLCVGLAHAASPLTAAQVPSFQIRFRLVAPADQKTTQFALSGDNHFVAKTQRDGWSDWLAFGSAEAERVLAQSPNLHAKSFPLVVKITVSGASAIASVDAEVKFGASDTPVNLHEELFGATFGVAVWRDVAGTPRAGSLAEYNRETIWSIPAIATSMIDSRPQRLPVIDHFIGGSNDIAEWREGTAHLLEHGANTLLLDAPTPVRARLRESGIARISGAVYAPPGYAFEFPYSAEIGKRKPLPPGKTPTQQLDEWAAKLAKPYSDAGFDPHQIALYHLADEPGWYYPAALHALRDDAAGMARFHHYLQEHRLRPADLGAKTWDDVLPIGASQATDRNRRRLFYWTMQFFPWDSANYFAASTAAMERAFHRDMPTPVNWNFFSARSYVPGPVANNADKLDPDAAMGGHDWFEFAQRRGSTMLWTEDWFSDAHAFDWSFQASRLNSAARAGGISWGAYIIPRTSGETTYGLMQKVLSVVGNGGKAIEYFVFGPEYNFPGNCYSQHAAAILPKMSRVHTMLAKADELLWPGQRPKAQVAILQPRSSETWDSLGISDATNNDLNRLTVDYMAEIYDLYRGLQQSNVPVDFVAEDGLSPKQLRGYKVLFATEPDFPQEYLAGLLQWVREGGTLVTVSGALSADRYDQPMDALQRASGIVEPRRARLPVLNADLLSKVDVVDEAWNVYGVRGQLRAARDASVLARFADGMPAIAERKLGRGRFVHYAFLPGISAQVARDKKNQAYSALAKKWIAFSLREAGVEAPVSIDRDGVETPLLQSEKGAAITLLDWRDDEVDADVHVLARIAFRARVAESVTRGTLDFTQHGDTVSFALPLRGADIVLLKK